MADKKDIPVVILCGGMGYRLREETEFRPKPLVTVGNMPILWHVMKIYSAFGYKNFILCLGYRGEEIKEFFMEYDWAGFDFTLNLKTREMVRHEQHVVEDWRITFVDTGIDSKTGKRLKIAGKYLTSDTFFLTYGDGLANINIDELLKFHRDMGKTATITGIHPVSKYGVLDIKDGVGNYFREKPLSKDIINGGFMVFDREVLDHIRGDVMLVDSTLPELSADGNMAVYEHRGFWHSMDTYKDYQDLNRMWASNERPWVIW